jgi:hypothetical protein
LSGRFSRSVATGPFSESSTSMVVGPSMLQSIDSGTAQVA